jgi:ADP-ribosylglycohydrolase
MANGLSWQESGKGEENGSIIRSVPLGALYMSRKDLCKHVSELQAVGTHNSTKARACSVLIAEVTRLAIENKVKPYARYNILKHPRVFCKQLISSIISIEPGLEKYISTIPELIETRKKMIRESKLEYAAACILVDRHIVKIITSETAKTFGDKLSHGGETISSSAVQSCIFSIYCFLSVPDFFMSSIYMSIRSGGNTSGTAAIIGGIVGARLGLEEIPSYFVNKINDQGNYKSDELIQLCERLSKQKFSTVDPEPTLQTPMWAPTTTFGTTPQQPSTFGTTPQRPSIFGTTPQQPSTFGSLSPSMFGAPPQSLLGTHSTSVFGVSQNKPLPYSFGQQK